MSTPLATHFKLSKEDSPKTKKENDYMSKVPYVSTVGSLIYVMVSTRLNIAQAMRVVSRFMNKPRMKQCEAIKWIFRYLRGTTNTNLTFGGEKVHL